ncbi:MAG TPA: peptidylprolyl isomerase [Candidatus Thalassarchaeaceae archaeon]|nr:peptidylprolyl isomerase [Candidatus Thalassarchaeaceae archaeon]
MPVPEKLQKAWDDSVEFLEVKGDPEKALDALRSAWGSISTDSQRARTLSLAADAGTELGLIEEKKQRTHWQKAYKNYSKALSLDQNNKETRRKMNKLASMMDERAISLGLGFKIFDEGNPTPLGVLVIMASMVLVLSSFKLISELFDDSENPVVVLEVQYSVDGQQIVGEIEIELYQDKAPLHVESFLTHVENFEYDLTEFHRVIDGFMIQGGDIDGMRGSGGYSAHYYGWCNGVQKPEDQCPVQDDWTIPNEHENGLKHTAGALAAAHAGVNTDGSQFYIVPEDGVADFLDWSEEKDCVSAGESCHTVYGYVISGIEHVNSISEVPTNGGQTNNPLEKVTLLSVQMKS